MTYIIKQAYNKVIREVNRIEQKKTTETRFIYLYKDKIMTKHREFLIHEVMDISFKKMQGEEGLLFLHTDHGVYSYHVPCSPIKFIEECKKLLEV